MKPERVTARWIFFGVWCWVVLYGALFAVQTVRIRHGNTDDVWIDAQTHAGTVWETSVASARAEGRFCLPVSIALWATFFRLDNPWLYTGVRALLLLTAATAVGLLFSRLARSRAAGLLVILLALLGLQIPLGFNAVLSSPPVLIGFILTCLVLERLWHADGRRGSAFGVGLAAFLACCLNECFAGPIFLGAILRWASPPVRQRALAALAALGVFGLAYLGFRRAWPSQYSGTQLSLHPLAAARCLALNLGATFPGVELLLDRHGFQGGPLLRRAGLIWRIVGNLGWPSAALLGLGLVLAAGLVRLCLRESGRPEGWATRATLVALALSFVVPVCLTAKYQEWSYQRQYPYFYALCSWFFLLGLGTMSALARMRRQNANRSRWQRMVTRTALALVVLLLTVGVWASNANVVRILEQSPYPVSSAIYDRVERHP